MRSTRRKMLLPALFAVLALGAVTASAAQAATAEGPFYKITGSRLLEGKSKEVKAKLGKHFEVEIPDSSVIVSCSTAKFAAGADLLGSTGANFAGGEATLELSGCRTEGSQGASCELTSTTIKTAPLKIKTAYLDATRTGPMAMLFEAPAGAALLEVTFKANGSCFDETEQPWPVSGHLVGKVEVANKLVEVGKEPAAAKVLEIKFPGSVEINKAWVEKSGSLEEKKVQLNIDGGDPPYYGTLELEAGSAEWGIFT